MEVSRVNSVSFGRKPAAKEMKVYTESINKGLGLLNKQLDLILHNSSAPTIKAENTGIGSLFSRTVQQKLIPFLKEHGFSNIQQEPNGFRKSGDNSPYAPEAETKNIFMIPLEKLASNEYGNILSKETFQKIVLNNPNPSNVDYNYIRKMYDVALKEAYQNSKNSKEFLEFKNKFGDDYEKSALFRILNDVYKGEKWSDLDLNLYSLKTKEAEERIKELKTTHKDEYDYYIFNQMILEKENKKSNELAQKSGVKIIGDSPVAQSAVDEWVNKDLFLKGKSIGCPPDFFSKSGQRWGFKYYAPENIFNKDGSLGKAGEVLKQKYERYFASFPGGVRIDHTIGLVDPFIYTNASDKMTRANSGRIYSPKLSTRIIAFFTNKIDSIFAGKYRKKSDDEYAAMFNKIIIPAAKKYNLDKSSLICEDLGDRNIPTERVMKKLGLSGITLTQFDKRGAKAPEKNTIMIGSHDNASFLEYVDELFKDVNSKRFMTKTKYLAKDTMPKGASKQFKKEYLKGIRSDKLKFIQACFTDLFASPAKRVQIFFADFWGIGKTYNKPGTNVGNWELRVGENFEDDYYKAVLEGKAPNLAQVIASALRHRGLDKGNDDLMKNLDESAKILSE